MTQHSLPVRIDKAEKIYASADKRLEEMEKPLRTLKKKFEATKLVVDGYPEKLEKAIGEAKKLHADMHLNRLYASAEEYQETHANWMTARKQVRQLAGELEAAKAEIAMRQENYDAFEAAYDLQVTATKNAKKALENLQEELKEAKKAHKVAKPKAAKPEPVKPEPQMRRIPADEKAFYNRRLAADLVLAWQDRAFANAEIERLIMLIDAFPAAFSAACKARDFTYADRLQQEKDNAEAKIPALRETIRRAHEFLMEKRCENRRIESFRDVILKIRRGALRRAEEADLDSFELPELPEFLQAEQPAQQQAAK